jgi:hypothetical protein
MTHPTQLPDPPLSAWALLLSGLSQTAIGTGLLLGQAARVVERRAVAAPPPYALTTRLPLAELEAQPTGRAR